MAASVLPFSVEKELPSSFKLSTRERTSLHDRNDSATNSLLCLDLILQGKGEFNACVSQTLSKFLGTWVTN